MTQSEEPAEAPSVDVDPVLRPFGRLTGYAGSPKRKRAKRADPEAVGDIACLSALRELLLQFGRSRSGGMTGGR
jgi:hypothetical protein